MERMRLLTDEQDLESARSAWDGKVFEHLASVSETSACSSSTCDNGNDLPRRFDARRICFPHSTILFQSRPCCQSRLLRFFLWILRAAILFLVFSMVNAILRPSYANPPSHYRSLEERVLSTAAHGRGNVKDQKVYIATNIINEELIREQWGTSLEALVELLGEDNAFVSIYENDSGKGTQAALRAPQQRLKCKSSIVTGAHLPLSNFHKVRLPSGEERVQRITYLAEVRNQLLRPLDPAYADANTTNGFRSASHIHFDRMLFLNDVYFNPLDTLQLLFSTNQGDYRAACAVDFIHGPLFYNSFATRDFDGYGLGRPLYPWFAPVGSAISRNDVRRQTDAVRVRSCWGGMAAFEASFFQSTTESEPRCRSKAGCLPIQFRGSNESFWEAAECCLIFADIEEQYGRSDRVFVNPYVRVAYTKLNFHLIPYFQRFERFFEYIQYVESKINHRRLNQRRTREPGQWVNEVVWQSGFTGTSTDGKDEDSTTNNTIVGTTGRSGQWSTVRRRADMGGFCGERTMFVIKENLTKANEHIGEEGRNWEMIPAPRIRIGR